MSCVIFVSFLSALRLGGSLSQGTIPLVSGTHMAITKETKITILRVLPHPTQELLRYDLLVFLGNGFADGLGGLPYYVSLQITEPLHFLVQRTHIRHKQSRVKGFLSPLFWLHLLIPS